MCALANPSHASFNRKLLRIKDDSKRVVLGCQMPNLRKICRRYSAFLSLEEILALLQSNYQEARQFALLVMIDRFKVDPENIVQLYLDNITYVDNWDLVDVSAPKIIGSFYKPTDEIFRRLALDPNLWANRIAMVATIAFIRKGHFDLTLQLAEMFMKHGSHFLHKASGWMLREIGKRDEEVLLVFLRQYATAMPKIMLRYACERLSKEEKIEILSKFPG
jgi:3-methyladenine DNA glycosylase AlkD